MLLCVHGILLPLGKRRVAAMHAIGGKIVRNVPQMASNRLNTLLTYMGALQASRWCIIEFAGCSSCVVRVPL
jgi:hypothetical protein